MKKILWEGYLEDRQNLFRVTADMENKSLSVEEKLNEDYENDWCICYSDYIVNDKLSIYQSSYSQPCKKFEDGVIRKKLLIAAVLHCSAIV